MRILIVGESYDDTPVQSLERLLGAENEVRVFDMYRNVGLPAAISGYHSKATQGWLHVLKAISREPMARANRGLIDAARSFQPDIILIFNVELILPETIDALKQDTSAKVVGWYMDHVANFGRSYFLISDYDALLFVDQHIVDLLREKSGNERVHLLPICCDPTIHRPVELTKSDRARYGCDLTIAGNLYPYRVTLLEPFAGYDLKIWGYKPRWVRHSLAARYTGEPVYRLEKSKAMLAAAIVLNTTHYANVNGVNKRTFEVAAAGAFQISDGPGIAQVFEPETEIVTFSSARELKEKVDHYLHEPSARAEIADRAQRRTHAQHTFAHRWESILEIVQTGSATPVWEPSFAAPRTARSLSA
jgi:spore maturation protein CgeB